jgi:putative intracellular protease/amidase
MRIACLLDKDFEDSEFRKPCEALRVAGHDAFSRASLSVLGYAASGRP